MDEQEKFMRSIDFSLKWEGGRNFTVINGKPVVKITRIDETPVSKRIGVATGKFAVQGDFDADNREIADMLMGGKL